MPKLIVLALTGMLVAGCATQQQTQERSAADQVADARATLAASIDRCKQASGYDPDAVADIPEHELAPNELSWRQCAYDALRDYESPNPEAREQIELLIAQDIAMTAAIKQGTMTRSQRKHLNTEKFQEIRELELAQARAAASDRERAENVVEGLRSFSY